MTIWQRLAHTVDHIGVEPLRSLVGWMKGDLGERLPGEDDGEETYGVAFTIAMIALGAKMAKADGVVTPDEVDAFKEVFQVPPGEEGNVRRIFNMARQDVAGYEAYAKQVARLFRSKPGVLEDVLDGLFHIAKADNVIHPSELDYLERVADIFGFGKTEWERIRCTHMLCETTDPYTVLGIDPSITDDGLKKAYRRIVKENHPDGFIARGVPEEFIVMATEKLAAVNTAYEQIKQERGIH